MPNAKERLIRCLKYCASTTETGNDCVACERWVYDCGSGHCVDDLMLQAAEALEQMRWIPVTERLPEIGDTYLVVVKYKYDHEKEYGYDVDVAMYCPYDDPDAYIDKRWNTFIDWNEGQQDLHITHWMPLPQPPKEMPEEIVYCKDCENLMFSDCYGECAKAYKGIVRPDDTCEHGVRRTPKGE